MQMYVKPSDHKRLLRLAEHETRTMADEVTVIIDSYAIRNGLDPETMQPIETTAEASETKGK